MITRMNRTRTYRDCAVAGATPIGLLVALFDRLASDFRNATDAIRCGDIEARCRETNHAFLILGQLDSWVDLENGGESARQIAAFYAQLRSAVVQASTQQSAAILDGAIESVLNVRSKWQELDRVADAPALQATPMIAAGEVSYSERPSLSLTA